MNGINRIFQADGAAAQLEILADAAKYDASCASAVRARDSSDGKGLGLDLARHGHLPFLCA